MVAACVLRALALAASAFASAGAVAQPYGAPPADIEARLDRLVAAYPDHLARHDGETLYWRDGTEMPISDGRTDKSWDAFLNAPDIDDMLAIAYPTGPATAPAFRSDPGRIRYEPFFTKMYGDCRRGAIQRVPIRWVGGQVLRVSPVNGVAERMERVARAIEALPAEIRRAAAPSAGVFNCRVIAGTDRLSVHALAAAVDVNIEYSDYWRWSGQAADAAAMAQPHPNGDRRNL